MAGFTCRYFYCCQVLPVYVLYTLYLVVCMQFFVPLSILFGHFSGYFPFPFRLHLENYSIYFKFCQFCVSHYDLSSIYLNKAWFTYTCLFSNIYYVKSLKRYTSRCSCNLILFALKYAWENFFFFIIESMGVSLKGADLNNITCTTNWLCIPGFKIC